MQAEVNQRVFVRDMLAVVTDGRLHVCDTEADLPSSMPARGDVVDLTVNGGVRTLRHAVHSLAVAMGFEDVRSADLMTAVSEAAMNALVHAKGGRGWICTDGRAAIQVWIVDSGAGISVENLPQATLVRGYSTASTLGHGFKMIIGTADRVHLLTNLAGTTVVIEHLISPPDPIW